MATNLQLLAAMPPMPDGLHPWEPMLEFDITECKFRGDLRPILWIFRGKSNLWTVMFRSRILRVLVSSRKRIASSDLKFRSDLAILSVCSLLICAVDTGPVNTAG